MATQIFKTVLAGILAGIALFMVPFFILKVLVFFLLIKAIFRLMGGGRGRGHWRYAYAHQYKNMSEEERSAFMQKYGNRCGWNSRWEQGTPDIRDKANKTTDL